MLPEEEKKTAETELGRLQVCVYVSLYVCIYLCMHALMYEGTNECLM